MNTLTYFSYVCMKDAIIYGMYDPMNLNMTYICTYIPGCLNSHITEVPWSGIRLTKRGLVDRVNALALYSVGHCHVIL